MVNPFAAGASGPALRFRLLGLPVRIDLVFLGVAALAGSGFGGIPGLVVGASVVLLAVLAHELGHAAAAQAFGLRPTIALVWFGGATSADGMEALSRPRRLVVVASGAVAGAAVGGLAWHLGADRSGIAGGAARVALNIGVIWGLANLLPILPLDGGHLLVDLLPGRGEARTRRARVVSVVTAVVVGLAVALLVKQPVLALVPGWFAYVNLVALRSGAASLRAERRLGDAFARLSAASAAEAERMAREALGGKPSADVAAAAGELLLASHLARGEYHQARAALVETPGTTVWAPIRDLAILGDVAGPELARRLAGQPTAHDVCLAAVHGSLLGEHDRVAQLAGSALGSAIDLATFDRLHTRAFHAGAFRASIAVGEAAEARPGVGPHVAYNVACAWARLGDTAAALSALDRSVAGGYGDVEELDADDDLRSLRDLEAYRAIRRRMRTGESTRPGDDDRARRGSAIIGLVGCGAIAAALVNVLPDGARPLRGVSDVVGVDLGSGAVRWRIATNGTFASVSSSGGLLVVNQAALRSGPGGGASISFRDPATGHKIASFAGRGIVARAADEGRVLVSEFGPRGEELRAIEIASGGEQWTREPDDVFTLSRVLGGVGVMASVSDVGIQAVDLRTGALLWRRADLQELADGPLDAVVAVSSNGHRIVSLDPWSGAEHWAAVVNGPSQLLARHVWVDESPGELVLVNVDSGERQTLLVGDVTAEPLVETDQGVVVRTADGIRAIDLPSGQERWRQPADHDLDAITVDGMLVLRSSDAVVAYEVATGQVVWRINVRSRAMTSAGATLLLHFADALRAVDVTNGNTRWTMKTGGPLGSVGTFGDTAVFARR